MDNISMKTVNEIIKLLRDYRTEVNFTPEEFVAQLMCNEANKICNKAAKIFILIKKNEKILECIVENYSNEFKTDANDMILLKIIIYLIIFEITESNYNSIKDIFKILKIPTCIDLLKFLNREEFLIVTTEASCNVYDNDYVLNSIINPLINRTSLIEELQHDLIEKAAEKSKPVVKPPTKCLSPKLITKKRSIEKKINPKVKIDEGSKTVVEQVKNKMPFKKKEMPSTTFQEDNTKKKILDARKDNRASSLELLKQANENPFRCSKSETYLRYKPPPGPKPRPNFIKPKEVPKFKPVGVKNNTTALMRQAALFAKAQENEIKKLEALTSGAFDDAIIEEIEEEERKRIQREKIQDIEKKHIQGLLSHEEAAQAKWNFFQSTRKKAEEVKAEKDKLYRELEDWKRDELEKLKKQVEKTQIAQKAFKESEKKVQGEKFMNARMLELESKKLLEDALAKKKEELNKKMALIKEIKYYHENCKASYQKGFDPTETPNLGLMCEMSIAELQERLGLVKMELKYELEKKQKTIKETRQQKKDLLTCVQEYIDINMNEMKAKKEEKLKKPEVKLESTEEIQTMKHKLNQLRDNRLKRIPQYWDMGINESGSSKSSESEIKGWSLPIHLPGVYR